MKKTLIYLLIGLTFSGCYDFADLSESFDRDVQPRLVVEPGLPVTANGKDTVRVEVTFPKGVNDALAVVNFTVDEGIFTESGKNTYTASELYREGDRLFIPASWLTTTTVGEHFIRVEVPKVYKASRRVTFGKSFPATIAVAKDKFAVRNGYVDEITFTASLRAEKGLPSKGTRVFFVVADTISSETSNLFRAVSPTNESGVASAKFSPGSMPVGEVSFKAFALTEANDTIASSGVFQVLPPEN